MANIGIASTKCNDLLLTLIWWACIESTISTHSPRTPVQRQISLSWLGTSRSGLLNQYHHHAPHWKAAENILRVQNFSINHHHSLSCSFASSFFSNIIMNPAAKLAGRNNVSLVLLDETKHGLVLMHWRTCVGTFTTRSKQSPVREVISQDIRHLHQHSN